MLRFGSGTSGPSVLSLLGSSLSLLPPIQSIRPQSLCLLNKPWLTRSTSVHPHHHYLIQATTSSSPGPRLGANSRLPPPTLPLVGLYSDLLKVQIWPCHSPALNPATSPHRSLRCVWTQCGRDTSLQDLIWPCPPTTSKQQLFLPLSSSASSLYLEWFLPSCQSHTK